VKDALLSCWTKLRSTRWCFLDYTPDIRGCYKREGVLTYILKFRTKLDVRDSVDWMNTRVPPVVKDCIQQMPQFRW